MALEFYYLLFDENESGPYRFLSVASCHDFPENGTLRQLQATAKDELQEMNLKDSSEISHLRMRVYELKETITDLRTKSQTEIEDILGDVNETFFQEKTAMHSSGVKLQTILPPRSEDGRVLVVISLPKQPRVLYPIEEANKTIDRETIIQAALKRESPSAGAKTTVLISTQTEDKPDAVYNGRPFNLTSPPIEIYHQAFTAFRTGIASDIEPSSFSNKELTLAYEFMSKSAAFYEDEPTRIQNLFSLAGFVHNDILTSVVIRDSMPRLLPDGIVLYKAGGKNLAAMAFTEVKNGLGDGGCDPTHQAEADYVCFYSSKDRSQTRAVSCCPSFLIGISGCSMAISGAVFTDHFISQRLMDDINLSGVPRLSSQVYKVARVLRLLKDGIADLKDYYTRLDLSPAHSILPNAQPRNSNETPAALPGSTMGPSISPHFTSFRMLDHPDPIRLKYHSQLLPRSSDKAIFKASARLPGDAEDVEVVVKFTDTYCQEAHRLLEKEGLAPKLFFCEKPDSVAMYVVVMEFVKEEPSTESVDRLPGTATNALRNAVRLLHAENFVFGDLRRPNIILHGHGGFWSVKIVDFDWSGKFGQARYPADINMVDDLGWHEGVERGGKILPEHDKHLFKDLTGEDLSD